MRCNYCKGVRHTAQECKDELSNILWKTRKKEEDEEYNKEWNYQGQLLNLSSNHSYTLYNGDKYNIKETRTMKYDSQHEFMQDNSENMMNLKYL